MSCTLQLCEIFQVIFTLSQSSATTVLQVWKYATIVPVACSRKIPKVLNDYRPVALTLPVMKLIKLEILKQVDGQFTFSHLSLPLGQVEVLSMQKTGTFFNSVSGSP